MTRTSFSSSWRIYYRSILVHNLAKPKQVSTWTSFRHPFVGKVNKTQFPPRSPPLHETQKHTHNLVPICLLTKQKNLPWNGDKFTLQFLKLNSELTFFFFRKIPPLKHHLFVQTSAEFDDTPVVILHAPLKGHASGFFLKGYTLKN